MCFAYVCPRSRLGRTHHARRDAAVDPAVSPWEWENACCRPLLRSDYTVQGRRDGKYRELVEPSPLLKPQGAPWRAGLQRLSHDLMDVA